MSDGWKIAQGLKSTNQNNSIDTGYRTIDEIDSSLGVSNGVLQRYMDNPNSSIEDLREKIIMGNKIGIQISGTRENITFSIDQENPSRIIFGKSGLGNTTVEVNNGEIVYSEIEEREERDLHYYSEDKNLYELTLIKSVYVIDGSDINEYYKVIDKHNKEIDVVIEEILSDNPEYSSGKKGEFYRQDIEKDEEVKDLVVQKLEDEYLGTYSGNVPDGLKSGLYEDMKDANINRKSDKMAERHTYADYIKEAKEFEEQCKYVYSLIMEAYKGIKDENIKKPEFKEQEATSGEQSVKENEQSNNRASEIIEEEIDPGEFYEEFVSSGDKKYEEYLYQKYEGEKQQGNEEYAKHIYRVYEEVVRSIEMRKEEIEDEKRRDKEEHKIEDEYYGEDEKYSEEQVDKKELLEDMTPEELQKTIEENDKTITDNEQIIKQKLVQRVLEQQRIIEEQQAEIDRLKSQKEL